MKFGVIAADCPWTYEVWSDKGTGRSAEQHYDVLNVDQICAMRDKIDQWADRDCALFLWAVYPNILDAFRVMEAWGFTYKTVAFTWVKTTKLTEIYGAKPRVQRLWGSNAAKRIVYNKIGIRFHLGMGMWSRANPEIVLLGTRGHPEKISRSVRNLVLAPIGSHSTKPDEVYKSIENLIAPCNRLEMFARKERPGWRTWGLEAPEGVW
jgi:N6-adenosine-specific RNA methylase IME4